VHRNVFWTAGLDKGYVATCPPCTASNQPPSVLAKGLSFPQGLAVNDGYVFVAAGNDATGVVLAYPTTATPDAAAPPKLADEQVRPFVQLAGGLANPAWIVLDDTFVYWTNHDGGTVMRTKKN
jgi:hypothetical protein